MTGKNDSFILRMGAFTLRHHFRQTHLSPILQLPQQAWKVPVRVFQEDICAIQIVQLF
jgi:hypothetical protein